VFSARFAPDGQSVVYSAAWDGQPTEIFSVRLDGPESRSLGLPNTDLLSVSATGELAICMGRRVQWGFEGYGTLARVPLGGGAPRQGLENVGDADWGPGDSLAVARDTGLLRRLEFPIGKVLYETAGWISHVRVGPDGRSVLFLDHPARGDNVGTANVVDEKGTRRPLGRATIAAAWAPKGDGIWLSTGDLVDLAGKAREVLAAPGISILYDVAKDGRQLLGRANWRREIVGLASGGKTERNLTWLDWSHPDDLTTDGRTLLFDEQNQYDPEGNYTIYLRAMDGAPAVRLGLGTSIGLSPDGKWALTSLGRAADLVLLPTGPGEPRRLAASAVTPQWAEWFPDGERLLVSGNEAGHGNRLFVREIGSGKLRAVSPEGAAFVWKALSPDGRWAVATDPTGMPWLYPIEAGEAHAVPKATPEDVPIRWSADGRSLYVQRGSLAPARIDIVDIATGQRRLWKELTPPDPAGVNSMGPIVITPDGSGYVYSYRRLLDDLFVADGLR